MRQAPKRRHLRSRAAIFEKLEWRTLLASISGTEFSDLNGDGDHDLNEPALSGWTVYLDLNHNGALNGAEPSVVTGVNGQFSFTNLSPGNYTLRQVVPSGWEQTHPGGGAPALAPLAAAASSSSQSSGIPPAIARMTDLSQYGVSGIRGARSWVVGLKHGASIRALAKAVRATSYKAVAQLSDTYIVKFNPHQIGQSSAMHLGAARGVAFFYPMISSSVGPRSIPDDPLFSDQWNLLNTGQNGGTAGQDANITSVWDSYQGNGVTIGIVDSGVDYTHPDLATNYNAASSFDFLDNDSDPAPVVNINHGTQVAGIAGARGNNTQGISGAAPQATLAGLRLFSGNSPTSDQQIADALSYLPNTISVYNNSWGPPDTGLDLSGPGPLTLAALQNGVTNGRNGLGNIYVWAAGNGLLNNDNVNYDGYANSRYALAVTAIDNNGVQPPYAEPGAPILVSAYSSGIGAGTTSTSNGGNYTNTFGETSSAAPLVSGVVALMLQANPGLGWRDVEHILALSARKNDATDSQWITNGAGLHVNNKYGFGAIDATAAVSLAVNWNNVTAETSVSSGALLVNQAIPDNSTTGLTQIFDVTQLIRAETVEVILDATHTDRGDLRVVLISPDGTQSVLAEPHFDSNADYDHWTFTTKRDWDEMATGTWTLKVTDESASEVGTFDSWQLNIYGTTVDPNTHDIVIASASDAIGGMDFGNQETTPPTVTSAIYTLPAPQTISLHFSEDMDDATFDASDLLIHPTGGGSDVTPASVSYSAGSQIATFTLTSPLAAGAYTATLAAGSVADLSGNSLAADYVFSFGEDANPPIADAGGPYTIAEGGSNISLNATNSADPDSGQTIVNYEWDLNNDNNFTDATGASPSVSWNTLFGLGVNDNGDYTVRVRVSNNLGVQAIDSATLTVTNSPPSSVTINGPATAPEGSPINLTATVNDPGNDTFTYAWSVTKNGNPFATGNAAGFSFTPDDNASYVVSLTVTDDDLGATPATPLTINVTNVAAAIALSGNSSTDEGSTYTLNLGAITDPGTDTVSLYRITWGDGSDAENFTPQQIIDAGGVVTHLFDDGPSDKTITVRLGDEDGIAIAGTLAVHVNNLDPTGTLASGGDVNISEDGFVIWLTPADPSTEDASNLVYDYDFDNDGTYDVVGSLSPSTAVPGTYLTTLGSHTLRSRIRDNDGQVADGAARDGILEQTTTINVVNASLRVLNFTSNASGFSIRFNKPVLSNLLNLYDGNDVAADLPDVVVTRASDPTHPVRGSLVWDSSSNTATWVATGGVLANDTYGVKLVSGSQAWTAGAGDSLDGEPDTAGLEDYQQQFVVNWSNRSISLPDFARGAGQNVNLPTNLSTGIPISISNPQGVTSVDFNLFYNPQLLNITAAALASGVPGGWTLTSNFTNLIPTLSRLRITMSNNSQLSGGTSAMQIVKLTADVPFNAPYGSAQVLRIENVVINGGSGRGDYALHTANYVGDANHNSAYSGADSALISRVVAELDTGFDSYATVDPLILADVDANAQVQGQDASWTLQKSLLASLRPEIPDIPVGAPFGSGSGPLDADVVIDIPDAIPAANADSVSVPLNLDSVAGLMGFNVTVVYDRNRLSLADGADSVDVSLGQLFTTAGGWTMASYVQQDTGKVVMGFYRSDPIESSSGNFGNLNFHVAPDAPSGTLVVTPIGLPVDDPFSFNYSFGTLQVVATGPTVLSSGFHLDPGSPMSVQLVFSGDVSSSLSTADLTVTNQTDSTVIPTASLALSYNTGNNTATLTFPGFANGVLPDGNYQVVVNASGVRDQLSRPMQTNATMDFFFLNGDANHDRVVNSTDLLALAGNYQTAQYDFSRGDLNFDGLINNADLTVLASNWQKVLPQAGGLSLRSVSHVVSPARRTPPRPLLLDLPLS